MQIINDFQWTNGLDSISYTLGQGAYQWAQNVVNRGGILQTRQGWAELAAVAGQDPRGGGTITIGGTTWLLACMGNGIYRKNLNIEGEFVRLNYPKAHPSDPDVPVLFPVQGRRMVHFELCVQAQYSVKVGDGYEVHDLPAPKFVLIIQDGVTRPHYWDGVKCDYVDNLYPETSPNNTPKGSFMKWAGDRLWTVSGRKVRASDLLNPFQNTEELITASGGFFFLPDNAVGMGVTHDYKSLLCFTAFTTSAFQVGLEDRTQWPNTQDFQRVIFPSIGCASHRTIINMYGMTWWMSHDGWVGLDNTLSAYQSSRLDVQDQNMSRSKEGVNWAQGGGCAGSFGNFLFVSVPSSSRWNTHTWLMDQAPLNTLAGIAPPVWAANWLGIRPEIWITCQVAGRQRCFALSRDLTNEGHQATLWEAFIGQRMDVPKVGANRKAKDILCAFETRFLGLSPTQYMKARWIEIDLAEIIGNVQVQVFYAGRRTSYKKILDTIVNAQVTNDQGIINSQDPITVYVPQSRTLRSFTDSHDADDNDSEVQTPYNRNIDREFTILVMWVGQMAVTAVRLAVDEQPDYMEGGDYPIESLARKITAEGVGSISGQAPLNSPTGEVTSRFLAPRRPKWVEVPAYDSAVPNGVYFVSELEASPPAGGHALNEFPITVSLISETQGIDIYYTLNGQTPHGPPNPVGTSYPPAPSVALGQTLKAIGVRDGLLPSVLYQGTYTQAQVLPVTLTPPAGAYDPHTLFPPTGFPVTMSCPTAGSEIRFKMNTVPGGGTIIGIADPLYDPLHPPHPAAGMTIHAKAFKANYLPSVQTNALYTAIPQCATPTCTPVGAAYPPEDYSPTKNIAVAAATTGATLRYTINSTNFDTDGININANTGHVLVHANDTLRIKAMKSNFIDSEIKVATYTVIIPQVSTPNLDPDNRILTGNHHSLNVDVDCSTPNVTLYYEIMNHNENIVPTHNSPHINASQATITIGPPNNRIGNKLLRVIAAKSGMTDSDVAEGHYQHD